MAGKIVIVFVFGVSNYFSYCQESHIPRDIYVSRKFNKGILYINEAKYDSAQLAFEAVISDGGKLPQDLAFYYGKSSFYNRLYKQAINWFNKYIQLKGSQGRFYPEAVEYLRKSEQVYLNRNTEKKVIVDTGSDDFDCGGLEKMICPVCHGTGLIISKSLFGQKEYQSCPYSFGEGYLSCKEYNLLMKGQLKPKQ